MDVPLSSSIVPMFALPGFGGWEIVLILAGILLLFGARRLPEFFRGLRAGFDAFKNETRKITDDASFDAGKSVGGIYGKSAAQALTPDNHIAELYDPAVFQKKNSRRRRTKLLRRFVSLFRWLTKFFKKH